MDELSGTAPIERLQESGFRYMDLSGDIVCRHGDEREAQQGAGLLWERERHRDAQKAGLGWEITGRRSQQNVRK
jgi:hypothetical protein